MILSEGFTSNKEVEEQLFKLFLDYTYFAKMAADRIDHLEVYAPLYRVIVTFDLVNASL